VGDPARGFDAHRRCPDQSCEVRLESFEPLGAGDGHRSLTRPLIAYYTEKGCPPGDWLGTGVQRLGTHDRRIEPGGTVTENHLRRLLGQGRDSPTIRSACPTSATRPSKNGSPDGSSIWTRS
jgi:hypothetical protein